MNLPIAFYVLTWVFATSDGTEREIFFADKYTNKIQCVSQAVEFREQIAAQDVPLKYSRFVCVPVSGE